MEEEKVIETVEQKVLATEEVATLLKRSREEKGLSLQEAESATRIPAHYLQLLEGKGDARLLADVLYLVPFLRTYSVFLGLDPAGTVSQFIEAVHKGEVLSEPVQSPPHRVLSRALVALFLVGLAVATFLWLSHERG